MNYENVAVVILNYNGKKYLEQFLPSVTSFSQGARIIVADNSSSDDSISFLQNQYADKVEVIELDKNYGFCDGYNRALKQISADYYVLLNSDVEVTESWLTPMFDLMENHAEIAACQPKVKMYHDKTKFEYAGAAGGFIDKLGYPFCRGRIFQDLEVDNGQYDDEVEVFWATGACMMVRSDLYHQLGGLDAAFFAHMEEIDLCWRLKKHGHKVAYTGKSEVYHVGGGTLDYANPRKTYFNFRNSLFMLYKNLPTSRLFPFIFLRMVLDGVAGVRFVTQGQFNNLLAILKAHGAFYQHLPYLHKKRKEEKKLSYLNGHWKGLLISQYFLAGKKDFKQLGMKLKEFKPGQEQVYRDR
ncbi:glycosyltransferase family 2 protein [Limibacter armeniacum]|uniref:glycosyltransferase family 2 protein n=1 Tax=Limibacter armeniacum TaxID=466084 RepID=UPI002FE62D2F